MIFHENRLLADDLHEISFLILMKYHSLFFSKIKKAVTKSVVCCRRDWRLKSTKHKLVKTEKLERKASSSSSRQKRNEFYGIPMYHNIENEQSPSNEDSPGSSKDYEVKIELKDKSLAVTFSLKNGKTLNSLLNGNVKTVT